MSDTALAGRPLGIANLPEPVALPWRERAACLGIGTEYFFPDAYTACQVLPSIAQMCEECPVHAECYEHAITSERFGYWAGTSERQRNIIRRNRGIHLRSVPAC